MDIEKIEFDERGLVPAVFQDHATGEVLMLAYMNAESLARTLQTGETWFWSRSRQETGGSPGRRPVMLRRTTGCWSGRVMGGR